MSQDKILVILNYVIDTCALLTVQCTSFRLLKTILMTSLNDNKYLSRFSRSLQHEKTKDLSETFLLRNDKTQASSCNRTFVNARKLLFSFTFCHLLFFPSLACMHTDILCESLVKHFLVCMQMNVGLYKILKKWR